jgi:hypothetical protein
MRKITTTEAKKLYGIEKVFETEAGTFLLQMYGKYKPNMTFIVPMEHEEGTYEPKSNIHYIEDKEITDEMNIDWNGAPSILFGDYWISKKGSRCFRPKSAAVASHILVRVDWGGGHATMGKRGNRSGEETPGVIYFHRAVSNGGGLGADYYVFPMGYKQSVTEDEDVTAVVSKDFETRIRAKAKKAKELTPKLNTLLQEIESMKDGEGRNFPLPRIDSEYIVCIPGTRRDWVLDERLIEKVTNLRNEYKEYEEAGKRYLLIL